MTTSAKRPPRSDAVRNRTRVLDAAQAVIAEHGTDVSTELVAAHAGVGVGTVFRHFPTKEHLLGAVLERMLEELAASVRARLEDPDPGKAFFEVLTQMVEGAAAKKAVADGLATAGADVRRRVWAGSLRESLAELLARAQKARAVRRDIGLDELMAVFIAATRAAEHLGKDRARRQLTVGVIFDGLRPR